MSEKETITVERSKYDKLLDMAHVVTQGKYFLNPWKTVFDIPHPMIGAMPDDLKEYVMPKAMYEDMMDKLQTLRTFNKELEKVKLKKEKTDNSIKRMLIDKDKELSELMTDIDDAIGLDMDDIRCRLDEIFMIGKQ